MKHTLLLVLITTSFTAFAQTRPQSKVPPKAPVKKSNPYALYFELNLEMGIPLQDFAATTDALPFGMNGAFFYQPSRDIPLMVGFDLGYMNMGIVTQDKVLTADITVGDVVIDQLIIPLRVQTSNNIFNGHIILRSVAPTRYFKPYIEGLFGFNNFWTGTEITDESPEYYLSDPEDNVIARSNQISDAALSYGAGGGFLIELGKNAFINLRADYLFGGDISFYDKSQTQSWEVEISEAFVQDNEDNYSEYSDDIEIAAIPKTSKTDMLAAYAGITFIF